MASDAKLDLAVATDHDPTEFSRPMRWVIALTVCCLSLSACGGDGDAQDDPSSQAARAIEADAQERAESIVLELSDFPDGWRATPDDEDEDEDEEDDEAFNKCVGADFSEFTIIGEARSDDFSMGESSEASSAANVFESEDAAAGAVAELTEGYSSDQASDCMSELLQDFEDDEVEITGAEVGELSFTPPPGVDDAGAWQVVVTIEGKPGTQAAGVSVTAYVDLVVLRDGDAAGEVQTTDILTPFDAALRDELVAAVAERLS